MKKYRVYLCRNEAGYVSVKANTSDDARQEALKRFQNSGFDYCFSEDHWTTYAEKID